MRLDQALAKRAHWPIARHAIRSGLVSKDVADLVQKRHPRFWASLERADKSSVRPASFGERRRLPSNRVAETFEITFGTQQIGVTVYKVTVGFFDDGALAEVFFDAGKSGTGLEIAAREQAISLSHALQLGAKIEDIRESYPRDDDGTPEGPTGALLDYLALRGFNKQGGAAT